MERERISAIPIIPIEPAKAVKIVRAFLVNKLMPLNDYKVILLSQVKDVLTNCCIMYENGLSSALSFYDKVASFDYDENTRICYRNFLNNALKYNKENNKHKPQIDYIISILKRADIHGICDDGMIKNTINLTFDVNGPELYDNYSSRFNFDYKTKKYTNNSEMLDLIFSLYSIEQYEKAFTLTNDLIHKSKKENNFIYTFISYFNYNILIRKLKFEYFKEQQKRDFYRQLQLIDIDFEYTIDDNIKQNFMFLIIRDKDLKEGFNRRISGKACICHSSWYYGIYQHRSRYGIAEMSVVWKQK